jgi:hypothetical protein
VESWIRIRIEVKIEELWRLKKETWRVCGPLVSVVHHLDKKQDPDPLQSEKSEPDPYQSLKIS